MFILNEENKPIDLNLIPNEVDMYFWVFDNSIGAKDYFCVPLIMLESFYSPVIKLRLTSNSTRINPEQYFLNVPADYQILVGEASSGNLEINPISSLSGRGFNAFTTNPISSFMAEYFQVDVEDVLGNIKWCVPKMKPGQILCVPFENTPKPKCIYLVRDMPKSLEIIQNIHVW